MRESMSMCVCLEYTQRAFSAALNIFLWSILTMVKKHFQFHHIRYIFFWDQMCHCFSIKNVFQNLRIDYEMQFVIYILVAVKCNQISL